MNTFVELPPGLISSYDSVTLEAWADFGNNADWARLYDFGNYNDGGGGVSYAFFAPSVFGAAGSRLVFSDGGEAVLDFSTATTNGLNNAANIHIAAVYDPPSDTMSIYTNGQFVASASLAGKVLAHVDDLKCWIGRSMYAGDPPLIGTIYEFRVYSGALTGSEIQADFAAGPNIVVALPPRIDARYSSGNIVLSWSAQATGFTLYARNTFGPSGSWAPAGGTQSTNNGVISVSLPATGGAQFFRLQK